MTSSNYYFFFLPRESSQKPPLIFGEWLEEILPCLQRERKTNIGKPDENVSLDFGIFQQKSNKAYDVKSLHLPAPPIPEPMSSKSCPLSYRERFLGSLSTLQASPTSLNFFSSSFLSSSVAFGKRSAQKKQKKRSQLFIVKKIFRRGFRRGGISFWCQIFKQIFLIHEIFMNVTL